MDKNEFFRQATLHICGNLVLEDAMLSIIQFLRKSMPVDRVLLSLHEVDLNAIHTIAMATLKKAIKVDLLTPLSPESMKQQMEITKKYYEQNNPNYVFFFKDNPKKEYFVVRDVSEFLKIKVTSIIIMPLEATGKLLGGGSISLITDGESKFSQQHADLVSLLKGPFSIAMSNVLKHRELEKLKNLLADDNKYLQSELKGISGDSIIGADFGLNDVMTKANRAAAVDSPVLLLGETGVGKDVVANAIHYSSARRDGPFIKVNCGAIPESLIDSELFGHEKGAFTGALSEKRGRFERANKGTIFLDEIGELPLEAQVRLLRVLQDKEIERVGGTKNISLDIRVIAATNCDIEEMVETGKFRKDLWFRLNVFPIIIPPLRERKSDIPALLDYFINLKAKELKLSVIPELAPGAIESFMQYDWPGNIRELQNIVERALILSPGGLLSFEHLNLQLQNKSTNLSEPTDNQANLDEFVSQHIQAALSKTNGKIHGPGGAAELLRIHPNTLRNRMSKLGINYKRRSQK